MTIHRSWYGSQIIGAKLIEKWAMAMRWPLHHFDCCFTMVYQTNSPLKKAWLATTGVIVEGGQSYSNFNNTNVKVLK
jgi:hypothetical protein